MPSAAEAHSPYSTQEYADRRGIAQGVSDGLIVSYLSERRAELGVGGCWEGEQAPSADVDSAYELNTWILGSDTEDDG